MTNVLLGVAACSMLAIAVALALAAVGPWIARAWLPVRAGYAAGMAAGRVAERRAVERQRRADAAARARWVDADTGPQPITF